MKLDPNWKKSYKWISMQMMGLAGVVQGAWVALPAEFKAKVPETTIHWATMVLLVAGMVGRVIQQFLETVDSEESSTDQQKG